MSSGSQIIATVTNGIYVLFGEVLKTGFAIDIEVELTRINEVNKIEPLGEIRKSLKIF